MARKSLPKKDKLVMVGGAVPPIVKERIEKIAHSNQPTVSTSQVVRMLLEEALRQRDNQAA